MTCLEVLGQTSISRKADKEFR
nr:hypothetical 2.4K protein - barley chloroplast [Hordeum vulgare]